LETVQAVQTPPITEYPESQVAAEDKSPVQVAIPVAEEVQAVHPVSAAFGPNPSLQRIQPVDKQTKQLSPQSVQTLEAKY